MKANTTAKWIVGITGAAFSAFVIGQLNNPNPTDATNTNTNAMEIEINDTMSDREKELAALDWSDFSIEVDTKQGVTQNDAVTRRT